MSAPPVRPDHGDDRDLHGAVHPDRPVPTPLPAPGEFAEPTDLDAFVAEVVATYPTFPALEMVVSVGGRPDDPQYHHFYDGSGRSRSEWHYDKSQPPTVFLHTGGHGYESFGLAPDGRTVWQDHGQEAYPGVSDFGLSWKRIGGWEHRGFDLVAGRPAHHLVCGHAEVWVDREWLLAVRSQRKPDPLAYDTDVDELVSLQFVQPPAELFELPNDACVGTGRPDGCTDTASPAPDSSG